MTQNTGVWFFSWMKGHQWCDFQFDEAYFPDGPKFIERLHARGLKVCVWVGTLLYEYKASQH